jgi:hypothetical protein
MDNNTTIETPKPICLLLEHTWMYCGNEQQNGTVSVPVPVVKFTGLVLNYLNPNSWRAFPQAASDTKSLTDGPWLTWGLGCS